MERDYDSYDTMTLTHELKLKTSMTHVITGMTLLKCHRSVSVWSEAK